VHVDLLGKTEIGHSHWRLTVFDALASGATASGVGACLSGEQLAFIVRQHISRFTADYLALGNLDSLPVIVAATANVLKCSAVLLVGKQGSRQRVFCVRPVERAAGTLFVVGSVRWDDNATVEAFCSIQPKATMTFDDICMVKYANIRLQEVRHGCRPLGGAAAFGFAGIVGPVDMR
jgi:hypothetical protein